MNSEAEVQVFKGEGFKTPTDERHCVNSLSIRYVKGAP